MIDFKSCLVALVLEAAAIYFILDFGNTTLDLLVFFPLHAVASVLLAWSTVRVLPPHYRNPLWLTVALLFSFAFFIPFFGVLGLLVAVAITVLKPRAPAPEQFSQIDRPEYVLSIPDPESTPRMSGLRTMLLDTSQPADLRLKSLLTLQNMPVRIAGPMLRTLLGDPTDDIRLLAYGMLDAQEKGINALIQRELQSLAASADRETQFTATRHLAELHWELVYAGLVQGDVRDHALAQALERVNGALAIEPTNPGLWFLKGRVLYARKDMAGSSEAFDISASCGLSDSRILPYIAEIAFDRRDFASLREYMRTVAQVHTTSTMALVIRFWNRQAAL